MVIFITNIFLISYLIDLEDLFDFENIYYERKVGLVCINLVSMTYVGGNDYNLIESDKVKTKFVHDQRWKICCYQILSFGLWWTFVIYETILLWAKKNSHLNYFEEPYIPPFREELHVEENFFFFETYIEVKEENIEISKEINNEDLVIKEESKIKNVEEINKDPSIHIDLEVEMVEIIKE